LTTFPVGSWLWPIWRYTLQFIGESSNKYSSSPLLAMRVLKLNQNEMIWSVFWLYIYLERQKTIGRVKRRNWCHYKDVESLFHKTDHYL
jgi:hypothetical protein